MKLLFPTVTFVALALILSSCFGGGSSVSDGALGTHSTSTGWMYNNAENGGFEVASFNEQKTGPGLVFIEGEHSKWVKYQVMHLHKFAAYQ